MPETVYRNYDHEQLNAQYSPRTTVREEDFLSYLKDYSDLSSRARKELPGRLGVRYGTSEDETLDLFTAAPGSPLVVLIHGGYWRMLSKDDFAFPALPLVPRGIAVASVNYGLAPRVSLREITRQCRAAVVYLYHHAGDLGFDRDRIFIAGHSAGGHLGGMLITGDWHASMRVPTDVVKGALLVSGLYDLEPVRLSVAQEWLNLSASDVAELSPARLRPAGSPRLVVSYGGEESVEFRRQTEDFAADWRLQGKQVKAIDRQPFNHFSVILDLARERTPLTRALEELVLG